jgi:hypothetical protein
MEAVVWCRSMDQVSWHHAHNQALTRIGGVPAVLRIDIRYQSCSQGVPMPATATMPRRPRVAKQRPIPDQVKPAAAALPSRLAGLPISGVGGAPALRSVVAAKGLTLEQGMEYAQKIGEEHPHAFFGHFGIYLYPSANGAGDAALRRILVRSTIEYAIAMAPADREVEAKQEAERAAQLKAFASLERAGRTTRRALVAAWDEIVAKVVVAAGQEPEATQGARCWLGARQTGPIGLVNGVLHLEARTHLFLWTVRHQYSKHLAVAVSEVLGKPVADVKIHIRPRELGGVL